MAVESRTDAEKVEVAPPVPAPVVKVVDGNVEVEVEAELKSYTVGGG